jgi:hypothetical protein
MERDKTRRNFIKITGQSLIATPLAIFLTCFANIEETDQKKQTPVLTKNAIRGAQLNVRDFGF